MYRFVAILSILAVLLLGLVVTKEEPTTAQEATSEAMATHPIVGTWRFVKDFGEGPTVFFGIFHADGTYMHEGYVGGPISFGAWQPTGERTADLNYHNLYLWDDRLAEAQARAALTVDETGATLEGPNIYASRYLDDGSLDYTYDTILTGTRVEAAPMAPLQELISETEVAATPVP